MPKGEAQGRQHARGVEMAAQNPSKPQGEGPPQHQRQQRQQHDAGQVEKQREDPKESPKPGSTRRRLRKLQVGGKGRVSHSFEIEAAFTRGSFAGL